MIGEQLLKKLFPDFEELIQPAGIDLRVDKVYRQMGPGSLIDDEKNLPPLEMLEPPIYRLEPGKAYLASVDRMIEIPPWEILVSGVPSSSFYIIMGNMSIH